MPVLALFLKRSTEIYAESDCSGGQKPWVMLQIPGELGMTLGRSLSLSGLGRWLAVTQGGETKGLLEVSSGWNMLGFRDGGWGSSIPGE